MKLRHESTGVTAEVSEETAANLDSQWKPVGEKKAAAKKAAAKPAADDK